MHEQPYERWPGLDDAPVIDAMLNDHHPLHPHHWNGCEAYVKGLVFKWANNFQEDEKEDISQNVMVSITKYLPSFKQKSRLTTWIIKIIHSRIADAGREKQARLRLVALPPDDPDGDERKEDYLTRISSSKTVEEESALREELREAYKKLLDHLSASPNKKQTLRILRMHIAGMSQKEIAQKLNMAEANVGYAIRSTQEFMRKKKQ
jgi:RNA polymerase sigma factor (sigma-70 family)